MLAQQWVRVCTPGNIYWSRDEDGQHIVENSLIQAAFGITVDWHWFIYGRDIPPQYYKICRQPMKLVGLIHAALKLQNGGHLGLEECMEDPEESELRDSDYVLRDFNSDVENLEYDFESESGDSDYVSAAEDA
ncbi:hypothetical protein C8J56DRAFT_1026438 [Mycena floridula]|nr:hypothetical protein C8J56DRAFT_1026438 [Mycena floridula]